MSGKGIGPAVFETAGKRSEHYLPGPYSRSLAKGGATGGVSANNGAILGRARGGEPRKLFVFTSAGEARETLLGGELLEAVSHAFDASRDYRPQRVMAMVVNGNSQAKSAMFSGDEEVLRLKTSAYGSPANGLSRRLCAGSRPGTKKLELACGGERETLDGIGRKSLRLRYSGNSPFARISVSGDGLSVETEEGTRAFSFEDFPNIGSLASRLNDTGEFAAEALDNPEAPSADLDLVEGANAKSADVTLASDFRALVEALESSGWIGRGNVEIVAGNRMPDDDDDPACFEGASAGGFTMGDWGAALQTELRTPELKGPVTPQYLIDSLKVFAFGDVGYAAIHDPLPGQLKSDFLGSAGGGGRITLPGHLNGEVDLGLPLLNGPNTLTNSGVFARFRIWNEF